MHFRKLYQCRHYLVSAAFAIQILLQNYWKITYFSKNINDTKSPAFINHYSSSHLLFQLNVSYTEQIFHLPISQVQIYNHTIAFNLKGYFQF